MFALKKIGLLLFCVAYAHSDKPRLEIPQGILEGKYLETVKGRTFSAFKGIPYAQPPVGDLRFKVAQPAGVWDGILDASKSHAICPQIDDFTGTAFGNEDCLYLNVYTPQLTYGIRKLLPVMVYTHGGGFSIGNGNQEINDPGMLLDHDVVLVVMNYRLGPLGFLSTGDSVVPGNNGLKDQNLAIKWTKENIHQFGGDPESLTIVGQSAGGACAHFHMLSPLSRDLIKGVISESGTALAIWAVAPNDQGPRNTRKLAESFNCPTEFSAEMIECLRKVDALAITKQQDIFIEWYMDPMIPFKPVVEPDIEGAFLPEHPVDIIKSDKAAKVPFITGLTTEDGAMRSAGIFTNPQILEEFSRDFDKVAPITMFYDETAPDKDYVTRKLKEFYFDDRTIDNSSLSEVTDMYTDNMFLTAVNDAVRLHVTYTTNPVYYYAFGYRGTVSYSELFGDSSYDYGVVHCDELLYLFPHDYTFPNYTPSAVDRKVSEILTLLWTNFAETGNPTPSTNAIISTLWKPVQSENLEYYFIKNVTDIEMEENFYHERAELWRNLPLK